MTSQNQAPITPRETAGATSPILYKGTTISLSKLQKKLFSLLSDGKRYSSYKIMQIIHTSDPRKEVQYLRRKGITVADVWMEATPEIPRHKLYFIDSKEYGDE